MTFLVERTLVHLQIPHAAISFAGLTGAITGMSAAGITVHEAGDDNKLVSLEGFSWSLRLRGVMENATNLAEVRPAQPRRACVESFCGIRNLFYLDTPPTGSGVLGSD